MNGLFLADCEILKRKNSYLCSSTDSLAEEIDIKLYRDPFTWGWMTVMSSVSDLAASGASPLGFLMANQWAYQTQQKTKLRFWTGVRRALQTSGLALLGGDSGHAVSHSHTGTILGESRRPPLTRVGARPGDRVVVLGQKQGGLGPALAFQLLFPRPRQTSLEPWFRPRPQMAMATRLAPLARASIDSSDGVATALDIIGRINNVGFKLEWSESWPAPQALRFCQKAGLAPEMLLMGDHGDFQTVLFVPPKNLAKVQRIAKDLVVWGTVQKEQGTFLNRQGQKIKLPTDWVISCPRDVDSIRRVQARLNLFFQHHRSGRQPGLSNKLF